METDTFMRLFDLHCDTATRLLDKGGGLYDNSLHISLKGAEYLESYAQVMAVWTPYKLSDGEGYARFFEVAENLRREVEKNDKISGLASNFSEADTLLAQGKRALILAVEDARILENDISRLDELYRNGVRLITLNWYGNTCIGGAHNTKNGLTDFGREVIKKCFELGIVPDVSHCSFAGAEQTLFLACEQGKPIVATHSDSYSVNPHTRNLLDEHFMQISRIGGLVGINLCPEHLRADTKANICDVMRHIEHYLSLGGQDSLAMGCDLDGTDLPDGFSGIGDIYKIADEMQRLNYSSELIDKIMFKNTYNFFKNNF